MRTIAVIVAMLVFALPAQALDIQRVADGVYALVGEKAQRSPQNLANNATFGFVVTGDGVVLVDPGGSWKGAQQIHSRIRQITDKPVKFVVNTGGQDHRWLGNGYWKSQGATIIASAKAVADQKDRSSMQFTMLNQLLGDELARTEPVHADVVFDTHHAFSLGGVKFEVHYPGHAHTPGDSYLWLPERKILFSGDIVYTERLLNVGPQSHSGKWIKAFKKMAARKPVHLIPGHGRATDLARAKADTLDYLENLRKKIAAYIEEGGDMIGSVKIDQSAFSYMEQFDALSGRNAQKVFSEMEWE